MRRACIECETVFDDSSPQKRRVGGLKTHCPDCSQETVIKYAGFSSGEGKQASVQIMSFATQKDRERYMDYWRAASGLNTGKNCQMAFRGSEPSVKREVVITQVANANHKGRAD